MHKNIALTGISRSGTTLACKILDDFENTIALAEPLNMGDISNNELRLDYIKQFYGDTRASLLETSTAWSRNVNGALPDNMAEEVISSGKLRGGVTSFDKIYFDKTLDDNFYLIFKDPAGFTAMLEMIDAEFDTYAIIRNPLFVMASWQTVSFPVNIGRLPGAETIDKSLGVKLAQFESVFDKQASIIEWFFTKYLKLRPEQIIKYEDIIASPHETMRQVVNNAYISKVKAFNMNDLGRYTGIDIPAITNSLERISDVVSQFYPNFKDDLKDAIALS